MPAVLIGGVGTIAIALLWMKLFPTLRDIRQEFENNFAGMTVEPVEFDTSRPMSWPTMTPCS